MKEIIKRAREGDEEWLEEHYPAEYYHQPRYIQESQETEGRSDELRKDAHEWWVGETGTGKSKLLWELYPNHFRKGSKQMVV